MCLSVFCVDVCLWIACLPGPHTGEEKVFNSLDSEVITVLSFDVGAGNQTLVLLNNRQCTEPLSHLSTTCLECASSLFIFTSAIYFIPKLIGEFVRKPIKTSSGDLPLLM